MLYGIQNKKNSRKGEKSSKKEKSKLCGQKTSQKRKNP